MMFCQAMLTVTLSASLERLSLSQGMIGHSTGSNVFRTGGTGIGSNQIITEAKNISFSKFARGVPSQKGHWKGRFEGVSTLLSMFGSAERALRGRSS